MASSNLFSFRKYWEQKRWLHLSSNNRIRCQSHGIVIWMQNNKHILTSLILFWVKLVLFTQKMLIQNNVEKENRKNIHFVGQYHKLCSSSSSKRCIHIYISGMAKKIKKIKAPKHPFVLKCCIFNCLLNLYSRERLT